MPNLTSELRDLLQTLNEAGVRYALAGGMAYGFLVQMRTTMDIDILVPESDLTQAIGVVEGLGFTFAAMPMEFSGGNLDIVRRTKIENNDYLIVDILVPKGALADTIESAVIRHLRGVDFPCVSPRNLIRLKQDRNSAQDQADIAGLQRLLEEDSGA